MPPKFENKTRILSEDACVALLENSAAELASGGWSQLGILDKEKTNYYPIKTVEQREFQLGRNVNTHAGRWPEDER